MKVLRTVTTTAVSAALVLGGGAAAFAAEGTGAPEAGAPATTDPEALAEEAPAAEAPAPQSTTPVDPVVAPAPEVPAVPEVPEVPVVPEVPTDEAAPADPAPEAPVEEGEPVAETPAADPGDQAATGADAVGQETDSAATETTGTPLAAASAFGALQSTPVYPDADYHPHWEDGGEDGFGCDYWYFMEFGDVTSGRDWQGWSGNPQLHILHHTLKDEDGTVHMVYDRDIANYWYHVWSGDETVTPDAEGIHWENTSAQQTVLVNGYKGGADEAARGIDAQALFARAGVVQSSVTIEQYQSYIDNGWWTQAQAEEYVASENARRADYTAYEATQFAVWYFSTGHDVMGLFFDVDDAGHVTLSQKALDQFTAQEIPENPDETFQQDWTRTWDQNSQSDRMATLQTAAWLIEQGLTANVVMPQPGFVSHGYVRNTDGSTDYGFTASLVGGTGDIHVELRTADGQAVPAGVTLVDANGHPISSVTPGQRVFVRVPAGLDVASLPQFQLWGSAQGTEQGSPHFYTGSDHNNHGTTDENGEWMPATFPHWLIGLGELDRPSTAWDWVGISLADEPEAPVTPEEPTDPENPVTPEDPTTPVAPEGPTTPVVTDAVDPVFVGTDGTVRTAASTDPTNLGLTDTVPVAAAVQRTDAANLASTGVNTGVLAVAGAFIVLTGTGLVLAGRRKTHATES
ncbi:hypothetical protein [Oerskovia paurometabola]|uniref:Gram-positive cocci surface proteins LPxTG domain-containing protein n=1 Tax=Oerskovia paurometabola TaxID=162170 RepID=A0ABW1XG00_9CELL|nr:hypothetical protein [Oerskovia paurometabola]MBM7495394.1 outer membrane biosynthesis protein TonB [Oerskovia paurometabola]